MTVKLHQWHGGRWAQKPHTCGMTNIQQSLHGLSEFLCQLLDNYSNVINTTGMYLLHYRNNTMCLLSNNNTNIQKHTCGITNIQQSLHGLSEFLCQLRTHLAPRPFIVTLRDLLITTQIPVILKVRYHTIYMSTPGYICPPKNICLPRHITTKLKRHGI